MEYMDFPKQEKRVGIFEPSDNNYFFLDSRLCSYLCSYKQVFEADRFRIPGAQVVVTYKRAAVVDSGKVVYKNENFSDGHICETMRFKDINFVIISEKIIHYSEHWYHDSHLITSMGSSVLYKTKEDAINEAVELSLRNKGRYVVAQWFAECDRYMGTDSTGYYIDMKKRGNSN